MSKIEDAAKIAASQRALEFVKDGMRIGLGTGSTASHFIRLLIASGLKIEAVATSMASEKMAVHGKIPLLNVNEIASLDLTIDGADEIDSKKRLIKGAGGALVREKIIANMSREMIVIADESKLVKNLGKHLLPVEIIPFGVLSTKKELESLNLKGQIRKNEDGSFYITDNGNWIVDLKIPSPIESIEELNRSILMIPGVVDSGFFLNLATHIVIGKADGTTELDFANF